MNPLYQIIINGIATGAIYSLIAVGFSITFMTTKTLNFALGMWVMLGGMLTFWLSTFGIPFYIILPIIIVLMSLLGIIAERFTVLPFVRSGSDLWIMSTLALGLLLIDFAEIIWGRGHNSVEQFFGDKPIHIFSLIINTQQLLVIFVVILIYIGLDYFYRNTLLGKAFRAVAHDRSVSSLMGINVRKIEMLSYSIASVLAGIAGFLIVPLTSADPHMGTGIGFKAFAIAIIAGLSSPRGILFIGLIYAVFEGLVSGYLYTGIRDIIGFSMMIIILYLRPVGIFGKRNIERV